MSARSITVQCCWDNDPEHRKGVEECRGKAVRRKDGKWVFTPEDAPCGDSSPEVVTEEFVDHWSRP